MHGGDSFMRKLLFLPPQASSVASDIDRLHYAVILITMLGALTITAISIVFCLRYRARRARAAAESREPAPRPAFWAELLMIGGLFALFVGFWAIGFWQYVRLAEPPAATYDIYVTGKQWMWKFAYPTGNHSAGALYVPAGRPIRLLLTSRDVIHSFYVPDFRVKHDAIPGRYTDVWFRALEPGTHTIFCAEFCGTDHSRMRASVVVLSDPDFAVWLQTDRSVADPEADALLVQAAEPTLPARGQVAAAKYGCLRCHSVDGSPHIGPTWKGMYGTHVPLRDGGSVLADVAYLTESMMDPLAKIRVGYASVMPSYQGYLQPGDVSAIVEFVKSLAPGSESARAPMSLPNTGVFTLPLAAAPSDRQSGTAPAPVAQPAGSMQAKEKP